MAQIRILIADDHESVRRGIRSLLNGQPDFLIVCEASDGAEAVTKAKEYQPDVVLLDVSMPQLNGFAATPAIREVAPHAEVLIVTNHDFPVFVRQAFTAGARGFVPKSDLAKELVIAVRNIKNGGMFLSERLKAAIEGLSIEPPTSAAAQDD